MGVYAVWVNSVDYKLKQTVLCGGSGQQVGVSGGSEVFGDENTRNRLGKASKVIGALSEIIWKQKELSDENEGESKCHHSTLINVWMWNVGTK